MSKAPLIKLKPYRHKKNGHWYIQFSLGKHPSGKRNRPTFSAKTKDAVLAKAYAFLEKHNYTAPTPTGRTVASYLMEWYESKKPDWSGRTRELYLHQIEKHILPQVGPIALEELAPLDVQRMVNKIVADGKNPTANKCRGLLYSALKQAVRWELIPRNPVEAVDPVREEDPDIVVWEPHEAQTFLTSVRGDRLYAAFYLMYASGMRRGEVLGLRWRDVAENGVRIEQSLVLVKNRPTFKEPKTKRSRRFISLGADTLDVLAAHRQRQRTERELCGAGWTDHDLVFPTTIGTPIHPRNFVRSFKRLARKAEVRETSPHALRHLHASLLIANKMDAKTISERLGHSSTSFTLDRYGHLFREHQSHAALTVTQLLGSGEAVEGQGPTKDFEA